MSDSHQENILAEQVPHPRCPECDVPMWLTRVEHLNGSPVKQLLHFECKVCESKAIIPPLQ
jgi:hypothetical protein